MIEDFFDHTCDIYHLVKTSESPGYGLPEQDVYSYGSEPDISGLSCHFGVRNFQATTEQQAPYNEYDSRIKLTLPAGTDIRINDKVVDTETGLEYTAEQPRNIRGHHIFVYIKKTEEQSRVWAGM